MSYRKEFPDFDPCTLPEIPGGFEDTSWHNDTCPSFQKGELRLFIDYLDPEDRENGTDWKRFYLDKWNPETDIECTPIIGTDDWNEVLAAIKQFESTPKTSWDNCSTECESCQ